MKINKQEFVQLMKEAYNNRLVTEDGEEQGETLAGDNPPADVVALVKAINARLQGKAEYLTASQAFLEYLLEWSEEGAQLGDLQTVCSELMKNSGNKGSANQLFIALKKASEIYRQGKAAKVAREPGQEPANRPEDIQEEMSEQEWKDELARLKDDKMHFTSLMNNAGNAANKTSDADRKNKLGEEYEFYKAKADQIEAQIEAHNASGAGRQMRAV